MKAKVKQTHANKIEKSFKHGDSKIVRAFKRLTKKKLESLRILKEVYKARMSRLMELRNVLFKRIELQKKRRRTAQLHRQMLTHRQYRKELNRWLKLLKHQLTILEQIQLEKKHVSRKLKILKRKLRPRIKVTQNYGACARQLQEFYDVWQALHEDLGLHKEKSKMVKRGDQRKNKTRVLHVVMRDVDADIDKIRSLMKSLQAIKAKTKRGNVPKSCKYSVVKSKMWHSPYRESVSEITLAPLIREQMRNKASHKKVEFNQNKIECQYQRSMGDEFNLKNAKCRDRIRKVYKVNNSPNMHHSQCKQKNEGCNLSTFKALRSEAKLLKARRIKKEHYILNFLFEEGKKQPEQLIKKDKRRKTDAMRRLRKKHSVFADRQVTRFKPILQSTNTSIQKKANKGNRTEGKRQMTRGETNAHHPMNSEEDVNKFKLGTQESRKDETLPRSQHRMETRHEIIQDTKTRFKKKKIKKSHRRNLRPSRADSISTNDEVRVLEMKQTKKLVSKQEPSEKSDGPIQKLTKTGVKEKNVDNIMLYENEATEPQSKKSNKSDKADNNKTIKNENVKKKKVDAIFKKFDNFASVDRGNNELNDFKTLTTENNVSKMLTTDINKNVDPNEEIFPEQIRKKPTSKGAKISLSNDTNQDLITKNDLHNKAVSGKPKNKLKCVDKLSSKKLKSKLPISNAVEHSLGHKMKYAKPKLNRQEKYEQFLEPKGASINRTVELTMPSEGQSDTTGALDEVEKIAVAGQKVPNSGVVNTALSEFTFTSIDKTVSLVDVDPNSKVNTVNSNLSLKTKTQRQRFGLVQDIVGNKVSSRHNSVKDKMDVIKNNSFLKHVNGETDSVSMNIKADHIWEKMRKSHNRMVDNNVGNEDIKKDLKRKFLSEVKTTLHNVLVPVIQGVTATDSRLQSVNTLNSRKKLEIEARVLPSRAFLNPYELFNQAKPLKKVGEEENLGTKIANSSIPHGHSQGDFERSAFTDLTPDSPNAAGDSFTAQSSNTNLQSFTSHSIYASELNVHNKEKPYSPNRLSNAKRIFDLITSKDTPSNERDLRLLDAYTRNPQKYNPILKKIYDSASEGDRTYNQHIIDFQYDALMRRINLFQRRQTLRHSVSTAQFSTDDLSGQSSSQHPTISELKGSKFLLTNWGDIYANVEKSPIGLRLDQQVIMDRKMKKKKQNKQHYFSHSLYSKPRQTSRQSKAENLYCAQPANTSKLFTAKNDNELSSVCSLCGFRDGEISKVILERRHDKYWDDEQQHESFPKLCEVCSDCGGLLKKKSDSSKMKHRVSWKSRNATIQETDKFCSKCSRFCSEDSIKVEQSIPESLRYQCRVLKLPIR